MDSGTRHGADTGRRARAGSGAPAGRRARVVSGVLAALAVTLTVAGSALQLSAPGAWAPWPPFVPDHAAGLAFPVTGAFLIRHRPRLRMAWLMCAGGLGSAVNIVATGLQVALAAAGHLDGAGWLRIVAVAGWVAGACALSSLLPLLSPDDRLPSRRWLPVAVVGVAATVLEGLRNVVRPAPAAAAYRYPEVIPNPLAVEALAPYNDGVRAVLTLVVNACVVLGMLSLLVRMRRAAPAGRRQIAWPLSAFAGYTVFLLLGQDYWALATVWAALVPVAIAFAVLRYRLYGIDTVISRTLVATGLLAAVGAVYFGVSAVAGLLLSGYDQLAGLAATLAAGALFQPLRARLRRMTDVMLYGRHGRPEELARRLTVEVGAREPANALAAVTSVVRDGLGVTGIVVEVGQDNGPATGTGTGTAAGPGGGSDGGSDGEPDGGSGRGPGMRVELGSAGAAPRVVPLVWHGEPVGRVLIGPPGPRRFSAAYTERLIGVAVPFLADVAHAVLLAADLQRSRERILTAREEERRRLRRDLHDGLGMALANMAMSLTMARLSLREAPNAADALLLDLRTGMDSVSQEVRELVYGLRPPTLDDLGLAGAVRALAAEPGPPVTVEAEGELTGLPAAVEVAAYRIVQEALTNARKHAAAGRVEVTLTRAPRALVVRVRDDGRGLPERRRSGVGFASMRERAAELGGTCLISSPGTGTQVEAMLPL
ncbi:sensor histidine kinase [Actinomadura sp. ATCC 31491]|uniref:Oxygen sensor histidine kinase NreB n=1 Tax=Actinomadura luzonensis TaxID=2805427 RepID=A0ABT0G6U1_9ACTN|nr:sensor histidine kinase [Actinomadura luzonensis]MCK2220325.1 sensor histidine kinase [Actinomadura luzonensis]